MDDPVIFERMRLRSSDVNNLKDVYMPVAGTTFPNDSGPCPVKSSYRVDNNCIDYTQIYENAPFLCDNTKVNDISNCGKTGK